MKKSDYLENALLNLVLGGTAWSAPATVYVALFTAPPADSGGGTEVSGNAYERAAYTNNTTNWPVTTTGSKTNANSITFPTPTGSWGIITHIAIFDALTGGNMLYLEALSSSNAISTGNTVSFPAGQITISED